MKRFKKYSISAILPCYNDENTIIKLIKDGDNILKQLTKRYEIIVVDDGSKDKSREKLELAKTNYPNLKLTFHQKNMGYGKTIKDGLSQAKYNMTLRSFPF